MIVKSPSYRLVPSSGQWIHTTKRLRGLLLCLLIAGLSISSPHAQTTSALAGATLKLFQAVEVNDMAGVKAALKDGAQLEGKNAAGKSAADVAVDKGHFIIAHFLLSARSPAKAQTKPPARKTQTARSTKAKSRPARPKRLAPRTSVTAAARPRRQSPQSLLGERRYPLPPRKPASDSLRRPAAAASKYGVPPRKPPSPIPEATAVAAAPGVKTGDDDLLPAIEEETNRDAPKTAAMKDGTADTPLGPVGRFFDTLLNLVRPDAPPTTAQKSPAQKAAAPRSTAQKDKPQSEDREPDLDSDLADLDDPKDALSDVDEDGPKLPDITDDDKETGDEKDLDLDSDLADLDKPDDIDAPDEPSEKTGKKPMAEQPSDALAALDEELADDPEEIPKVRRVGPDQPSIQKAQPVQPAAKAKSPATSTAGRTVERLQKLVGEKPKEDEFGLPLIDVTGSESDDDPSTSLAAELDDEKPGEQPASDDPLAGELPDIVGDKDDAPAPTSAPRAPVQALAPPRGRSPRYQSTMDRLRRLNEAVARQVRVDPNAILSEGRRAQRMAAQTSTQAIAPAQRPRTMPPSPVVREKLVQRETSSSRIVDRLERIRRDIYADEEAASKAAAAKKAAAVAARKKAEMAKLSARQAPPTAEGKEPAGVVSALAQFFKSGKGRGPVTAPSSQEYRRGHDQSAGVTKDDQGDTTKIAGDAMTPVRDEPEPGQKRGTMAPGFLESLSQMFTSQKVADEGWAADVDVKDPIDKLAGDQTPSLRPVDASGTRPASPPPPLNAPADAPGGAWTTTVQMQTKTGDPLVLQVSKSPDPGSAPPQVAAAASQPATAKKPPKPPKREDSTLPDLPALESDKLAAIDDLPAADDSDLPPAEGDPSPGLADDLPPAEGEKAADTADDLPPAEGEEAASPAKSAPSTTARKPPKKLPYSDPLRAPDPIPMRDSPLVPQRNLPRLAELKPGPEHPASGRGNLRLSPAETLAASQPGRYPTQGEIATRQQGLKGQLWPVTTLAKNDAAPVSRSRPAMLSRTSLSGTNFTLGESVSLESSLPPGDGVDDTNQCVKKNRGTTLFCVEPIDWPETLREKFVVPTILYTGPMAIIRYDQGAASRLHALFPSTEFQTVVEFYQNRYGNPTEIWKRSIAPLAEPRRDNPTVAWRSRDPKTNAVTILEIRRYDDTRGGFPDTNRGAVMLYMANSPAIFPQVSSHELMRLNRGQQKKPG